MAMARPIPRPEPVTKTIFSSKVGRSFKVSLHNCNVDLGEQLSLMVNDSVEKESPR